MNYGVEQLRNFGEGIIKKAGLPEKDAKIFVDSLITADMRGISSHGISRLRTYAKRIETKVVDGTAKPVIINGSNSFLLVDGRNGMGTTIGLGAMDLCIEGARKYGSCSAAVRNGNHFGFGAFYTMYAAEKGMIAFAMSNAPASMVPTGGKNPILGTNPLSVAIPGGRYKSLVLDMATSTVAQGKVILAAKEGKSIPEGWAVDRDGNPTTDPNAALKGAMLPFGGPKGYAIALIIDILCSTLSGAYSSTKINSFWNNFEQPQGLGFFMGALDISKIMPLDRFIERVEQLFDYIKACPSTQGNSQVFIPGEIEYRNMEKALKNGITLGPATVEDLLKLGMEYNVAWPFNMKG